MLKVLIVDDKEDILHLFCEILSDKLEVFSASSCKKAYEYINDYEFDAIISDINLLDGNGLDLLEKALLKNPVSMRIAISGEEERVIRRSIRNTRIINNYFKKPLTMSIIEEIYSTIVASVKAL